MTLATWWEELQAAALVGTTRREPPPAPALPGLAPAETPAADREERLLEQAALADVLRRAGRPSVRGGDAPAPAPAETTPPAGERAVQLLELLVRQPPISKPARDALLVTWLNTASDSGRRVPPRLLPDLLDLSVARPAVARALPGAMGERGAWLQALNPAWRGVCAEGQVQAAADLPESWAEQWPALPSAEATEVLGLARTHDPKAAREVLEAQWATLSAKERRAHLGALARGLGPADESFLERALDDRASSVRQHAAALLDRLPHSARAARMASRLAGLVRVSGVLRKTVEVDVPGDPDAAAVRDGLVLPRAGAEPDRRAWLAALVRGAPLDLWPALTGRDVATTVRMVADADVRRVLAEVVLLRGDAEWAGALLEAGAGELSLVHLLPPADQERHLLARLREKRPAYEAVPVLESLPRPWSPGLARRVIDLLVGEGGEWLVHAVGGVLTSAVPAEVTGHLQKCLDRLPADDRRRRPLTDALQFQSFSTSITKAFHD